MKSKLQSRITTALNLYALQACHRSLKKVPFRLSSHAKSAPLSCCRPLRVPFFSSLTMPFFSPGGNTSNGIIFSMPLGIVDDFDLQ